MATTTQNLGLIKPAGTDKIRIAQINSNMDTIDTKMGPVGSTPLQTQATNAASSISALQNGMAIVCNGNTHAAIPSGSYAYVRNHSSLAEGLYQATAAIAANATLSASNLTAVSGGGLNALNGKLSPLLGGETWVDFTKPTLTNGTHYNVGCQYRLFGCFVHIIISVQFSSPPTNVEVFTLPTGYRPITATPIPVDGGASYNAKAQCTISDNGVVRVTSVDKWAIGGGVFVAINSL